MRRTTTPDKYSIRVKLLYAALRLKLIAPKKFGQDIKHIWELRHAPDQTD